MNSKLKNLLEEEIQAKIKQVLKDPRSHINRQGQRFSENVTYSQAFTYVCDENPDLARRYAESLRPTNLSESEEKSLAAGQKIVELVNEKMKNDRSLTYSAALTAVQIENRDLILVYIGRK